MVSVVVMSKTKVLLVLVFLTILLILYESFAVWQYPVSTIHIHRVYSISHFHQTGTSFKSSPNVIQISHNNSSPSVIIVRQNASDATVAVNCRNKTRISRSLKEFYRKYEDTLATHSDPHATDYPILADEIDFLCINESEIWVKNGRLFNLTDLQKRSALAQAILGYQQDSDNVEVEEWAQEVERHPRWNKMSTLQRFATAMDTHPKNTPPSRPRFTGHPESLPAHNIPVKENNTDVDYLHELRQRSDKLYDQVLRALSRFSPREEDGRPGAGDLQTGRQQRDDRDHLHQDNLPQRNIPEYGPHNIPHVQQYHLQSNPSKNLPSDFPENFPDRTRGHQHARHAAKGVPDYYHVEQRDLAYKQPSEYRPKDMKYADLRRQMDAPQRRRSQTDVGTFQTQASVQHKNDDHMYPGFRIIPGGWQTRGGSRKIRPGLKRVRLLQSNGTGSRTKLNTNRLKLSEQLLQLRGFTVASNRDLVIARHFPPWKNSSEVASHLGVLRQAVNETESSRKIWTKYSLSPDIMARGKFQRSQMQQFCSMYHISSRLPSTPMDLDTLFQHLLYDDSKRIVYCYVPKVGCSNMKRMMMILNGILPPESIDKRPPEQELKQVHSFRNLTTAEALYKLNNYFKFAIVRNPMERLVSAYRNKVEMPFNYSNRHFPDRLKGYILRRFRKLEYQKWLEIGNQSIDIHPTFIEFLRFMVLYPLSYYNEHFKPVLQLCFPCAIHYDFYANFKTQNYDVFAMMDYLGIPPSYYPSVLFKNKPTGDYLREYFQLLPADFKDQIFQTFRTELEFYYALYPEERNMHVLL